MVSDRNAEVKPARLVLYRGETARKGRWGGKKVKLDVRQAGCVRRV